MKVNKTFMGLAAPKRVLRENADFSVGHISSASDGRASLIFHLRICVYESQQVSQYVKSR
jgi:hypothetical protein